MTELSTNDKDVSLGTHPDLLCSCWGQQYVTPRHDLISRLETSPMFGLCEEACLLLYISELFKLFAYEFAS